MLQLIVSIEEEALCIYWCGANKIKTNLHNNYNMFLFKKSIDGKKNQK